MIHPHGTRHQAALDSAEPHPALHFFTPLHTAPYHATPHTAPSLYAGYSWVAHGCCGSYSRSDWYKYLLYIFLCAFSCLAKATVDTLFSLFKILFMQTEFNLIFNYTVFNYKIW